MFVSTNKYIKYWKRIHNGRSYVRWREKGSRKQLQQQESRWIWEKNNGEIPKNMVIHHIDKNPLNNDINNLKIMSCKEHRGFHSKENSSVKIVNGEKVKKCPLCNIEKNIDCFYKYSSGRVVGYCKKCSVKKHKEWVKNNRDKANKSSKKSSLKTNYLISCPVCGVNKCRVKSGICKSCSIKKYLKENNISRAGKNNPNYKNKK